MLGNDTDPDGDALTVQTTPVVAPAHGSLTLNSDGTFTYTPDAGWNGTDTFTYRIVDADRLIAWQLYWRGENFWSGDEIWGPIPEMKTAVKETDNVAFLRYLNDRAIAPEGRTYYVVTEAGRPRDRPGHRHHQQQVLARGLPAVIKRGAFEAPVRGPEC